MFTNNPTHCLKHGYVMDNRNQDIQTLKSEAAVRLWQQGSLVWNEWVTKNPEYHISFEGVDFSQLVIVPYATVSFIGLIFPKGNISFADANFGDRNVSFFTTDFGEGKVNFTRTKFGNGSVSFAGAQFGEGEVSFIGAKFGVGSLYFGAQFGNGQVIFTHADFGDGDISFSGASFGDGKVEFCQANFGEGRLDFNRTNFGDGDVNFSGASFKKGVVSFTRAVFGKGDVSFFDATFSKVYIYFDANEFGEGSLLLNGIQCGYISFEMHPSEEISGSPFESLTSFSLRGATIDGPLILNNLTFNCVPDLRSTKLSHHVDMDRLSVNLIRKRGTWKTCWHRYVDDKTSQAKLRRLKEIAEQFKHHRQSLHFNALEMQATRWTHNTSFLGNVLDLLYSAISEYGKSSLRPFSWLIGSWVVFTLFYWILAVSTKSISLSLVSVIHMFGFSVINSMPFVPIGKSMRDKAEVLYFSGTLDVLYGVIAVQSTISLVLIFLLGLGLRNQFRI